MRFSANLRMPALVLALNVACVAALAQTTTYNLGRIPSPEEIQALNIIVGPAGKELPPGSGTAKEGAKIYVEQCAACHGPTGKVAGDGVIQVFGSLVGGQGTLNTLHPVRTLASWPFATTIWEYINRVMPYNDMVGSLRADEVYALTALLLYWNGIIQESDVMDAKSLPKIQMPNRNGFVPPLEDILDRGKRGCRLGTCP